MLQVVPDTIKQLRWILKERSELIVTLAIRMIFERHKQQALGAIWAFFHPALMVTIYLVVFQYVFQIKFPASSGIQIDYTLYLLSGLVPWLAMTDSLSKASTVFSSNAGVIKQVSLPLEIFPIASGISSFFYLCILMGIVLLYVAFSSAAINLTLLLLPVVMICTTIFVLGLTFIIGPLATYIKDIKEMIQAFLLINLYLMPIIYPPGFVNPVLEKLLYLNPFSYFIWAYQDVLAFGYIRDYWIWGGMFFLTTITFIIGFQVLCKVRDLISDSL